MPAKPKTKPAIPNPAAVLPGEADMLANVIADLSDDNAKLVYADWLEEHDDKRGPLLREFITAYRAGKKLPAVKSAPKPWLDLVGITLMTKTRDADLTAHANTFLRLARPALTFKSTKAADAKLPVGASKLGGGPDMPPGAEWPVLGGDPLAFLAQFNLADLHASLVCRELPSSGLLSIFSRWDEDEGNDDFSEKGSWRLFYFPDVSKLTRSLTPDLAFASCRLAFTETLTMPDTESPWDKELGLGRDNKVWDTYQDCIAGYDCGHRILGYPTPIQNDMLGKKTVRHLLTIGGDYNAGWEWGDGGSLYFTIGEEHLKAQKFDRVRMEMQCG